MNSFVFLPALTVVSAIIETSTANLAGRPNLVCIRGWHEIEDVSVESSSTYPDKVFLLAKDMFFGVRCCSRPTSPDSTTPTLCAGDYRYTRGIHVGARLAPYMALRQSSSVKVKRGGVIESDETRNDLFHINIHKGLSYVESGSGGCISIEPAMWESFIAMVDRSMSNINATEVNLLVREFSHEKADWTRAA